MLGLGVQHGGVRPARCTFLGNNRGNRLFLRHQAIDHVAPGAGRHDAFVLEVAHLHGCVMPVAVDQRLLLAQQVQCGLVLLFVELIRVLDPQFRLFRS